MRANPTSTQRSPLEQQRLYGVVRTTFITYGVAAFAYIFSRGASGDPPPVFGGTASAQSFVLGGLGMQILLIAARGLIKRYVPDRASAGQAIFVLELVGDGVTVLLFALGTLGAIMHAASDV